MGSSALVIMSLAWTARIYNEEEGQEERERGVRAAQRWLGIPRRRRRRRLHDQGTASKRTVDATDMFACWFHGAASQRIFWKHGDSFQRRGRREELKESHGSLTLSVRPPPAPPRASRKAASSSQPPQPARAIIGRGKVVRAHADSP